MKYGDGAKQNIDSVGAGGATETSATDWRTEMGDGTGSSVRPDNNLSGWQNKFHISDFHNVYAIKSILECFRPHILVLVALTLVHQSHKSPGKPYCYFM